MTIATHCPSPVRFFGSCLSLLLLSCAAVPLEPGAEKIIVTRQKPPKDCKFLSAVIGQQGGMLSGQLTSNRNLAEGALNDLRNRALKLGANYVSLESETAGTTARGSYHQGTGSSMATQTDVTKTGNAYRCPPESIGVE